MPSARFERALSRLISLVPLPLGYEGWSRHPVPTRAIRRTKAEPQPCAAAKLPGKDSNLDSRLQGPPSCH